MDGFRKVRTLVPKGTSLFDVFSVPDSTNFFDLSDFCGRFLIVRIFRFLIVRTSVSMIHMALLPNYHPQQDFFFLDVADVVFKNDTLTMEHPFYSLTTRPDMRHLEYRTGDKWLKINPSSKGLPTVFDRDILIFCISQLTHRKNRGEPIGRKVRFSARELLMATNRKTGGVSYKRLDAAFTRLQGTQFVTNIKLPNSKRKQGYFSLIESGSGFVYHDDERMRLDYCEVVLSELVMEAIEQGSVLSYAPNYFRLRRPLERRMYDLARKHCGNQKRWQMDLAKFQSKTGSRAPLKKFRFNVEEIIKENSTPYYRFELTDTDLLIVRPRKAPKPIGVYDLVVPQKTHDKARKFAGGWDTQVLEQRWRDWLLDRDFIPDSVEGSFIAFVKKYVEREGNA